jgi:transposase
VPPQGFGKVWRPGGLVVDRSRGDHQVSCALPYGYSQRRRAVHDLEQECPEATDVPVLVSPVAPPLALAMGRRAHMRADSEGARQAATLTAPLMARMEAPAPPLGVHRLQAIFRAHVDRLYHGADDRRIPAEHHLAERDLRPTVIARQVSFGSPSDAGAHTRGMLMSVLHTVKTRPREVVAPLKAVLDQPALDLHQEPFPLLFPEAPTRD